jgi:hypothetical protein
MIVAERILESIGKGQVIAQLYSPVRRDVDFQCEYKIIFPDRERRFQSFGIDEFQALLLALEMLRADLDCSPEGKAGLLRWLGSPDLGFP